MKSEETHYADYNPRYLTGALIPVEHYDSDPEAEREVYSKYDSLYHWFQGESDIIATRERSAKPDTTELLAALISDTVKGFNKISPVIMDVEPEWQSIRDTTCFVGGALVPEQLTGLKHLLYSWLDYGVVYLDASQYGLDRDKGSAVPDFTQLMHLAHNTKQVIEDGLIADDPADTRRAIRFLNAAPTDYIESDDSGLASQTKWFIEGRYIANELIKIREFRTNFNTVVIFGAHRYILSDQLNLTKLYRLFAKLGRINTRLVFIG